MTQSLQRRGILSTKIGVQMSQMSFRVRRPGVHPWFGYCTIFSQHNNEDMILGRENCSFLPFATLDPRDPCHAHCTLEPLSRERAWRLPCRPGPRVLTPLRPLTPSLTKKLRTLPFHFRPTTPPPCNSRGLRTAQCVDISRGLALRNVVGRLFCCSWVLGW